MNMQRKKPIRVGLADKSPLIHAAIKQLLSADDRFELVFMAVNCDEFFRQIEKTPIDVGVIGWIIGPCDGRFILDHLNAGKSPTRVIVYTGHESKKIPSMVLTHGAAAFVSKMEQPAFLLDTIEAVADGRMVFPYIDVRTVYDNPLTTLTRRELEVLADLASGRTNKQIARDMSVSLNTVKFHVRNLFQKLGVNSRSQAIALYLQS